jgi:hypothetical protein
MSNWRQEMKLKFVLASIVGVLILMGYGRNGYAADGYVNTVNSLKKILNEGIERERYIRYFCDSSASGKPEATMPSDFTGDFSVFEQNVRSNTSSFFSKRYPGSQFNCSTGSGSWMDGRANFNFEKGKLYKSTYTGEWGLTTEYDYPKDRQFVIVRIIEPQGNYVSILADLQNPYNSRYAEARLPITIQSAGIVVGDRGFQYTSDELVTGMNAIYRKLANIPNSNLIAYANALLIQRQEREYLISEVRKLLVSQPAKSE